jgi:universal stress protein E
MNKKPWKTIMVVISDPFARDQPALRRAVPIALRSGARLVLFNSFMLPQPVSDVPMDSQQQIIAAAIRQRRERLQSLAEGLGLLRTQCVVEWDYPAHEAIVRQVLKTQPDLLMTASHRHGRLARLLLANTDWELMRICPCPVWFVRLRELPLQPRILIAVDPFHAREKPARLDDRLMRTAATIGKQFEGHMSVVHACELPEGERPMGSMALVQAQQRVNDLAANYGIIAEEAQVKAGRPEEVIASIARREYADILVMGVVSRSLKGPPVIGNTAERVIDHVSCDVLVIKPAAFKAPLLRAPPNSVAKPRIAKRSARRAAA